MVSCSTNAKGLRLIYLELDFDVCIVRDAPLDFKGGGAQQVWVRTRFFFSSSLARKVFFYFKYLMGQVFFFFFFFFSSRWGKVFFFFLFVCFCFKSSLFLTLVSK